MLCLPILVRLYLYYSLATLLYFHLLLLTILLLSFPIGFLSGLLKAVLSFYSIYLVTIESGLYRSVRSVNQPPVAFGCQPPTLCTQCIRAVLRTASIELINTYSTILISYSFI